MSNGYSLIYEFLDDPVLNTFNATNAMARPSVVTRGWKMTKRMLASARVIPKSRRGQFSVFEAIV